ncbi:2,6-dihydroxypyridine 3-monooxygenase [Cytospora mali]|uniref:2,6-dihydroxypyridine 3-monooxygenase n=1 Tax=Cytospora mali TaxID=578113 RepID=A0A194WD07_CYTMA|nr:2,6-dihydroxypyridine 3-monooxygenase [Valsa mali]
MFTSVIIVGGSLSGLMHGVHLKREGVNVTILEQDSASERSSHNAGSSIDDNVNDPGSSCVNMTRLDANLISLRKRENLIKADKGTTRYWTNWGYSYRILRANFDGYASNACPTPPSSKPGDGYAKYLTGKRTGEEHSISSEFVIGADGKHSTTHKPVNAPLACPETYAGFIAWRGAVPRRSSIPNVAEGSADEAGIFTDANGHRYQRTVPQGFVDPHTWEGIRGPLVAHMAAPFAELVSATTSPFVTKVSDVLGSQASFCDGHVVLVGDALATYRSHAGKATLGR